MYIGEYKLHIQTEEIPQTAFKVHNNSKQARYVPGAAKAFVINYIFLR